MNKRNKKILILIIIATILLFSISCFAFYLLFLKPSNPPALSNEPVTEEINDEQIKETNSNINNEKNVETFLTEQSFTQEQIDEMGYAKYYLYFDSDDEAYIAETFDSYNADMDIMEYPIEKMKNVLQSSYEKLFYHRYDDLKQEFDEIREHYKLTNFDLYELTSLIHDIDLLSNIRQGKNHKRTDYLYALQNLKNDKVLATLMINVDPVYTISNVKDKSSLYPTAQSIKFGDIKEINNTNDNNYITVDNYIDIPFKVYRRELTLTTSLGDTYNLYLLLNRKIDGTYDYIGIYSEEPIDLLKVDDIMY